MQSILVSPAGSRAGLLNVVGELILVKLSGDDTAGQNALLHVTVPPLSGPPLHRHSREDEWFYVLAGDLTVEVNGERSVLHPHDSVFLPRGSAHTFQNFTSTNVVMLVLATPAGFDRFCIEVHALQQDVSGPPDFARITQLMNEYGMEVLGPPLA
ncbi:MAG: cupin domain-containing protein [Bryobacteraceae bacterium]|nr:cupin domain-containing protein [Bryobacteraceae bacterium]